MFYLYVRRCVRREQNQLSVAEDMRRRRAQAWRGICGDMMKFNSATGPSGVRLGNGIGIDDDFGGGSSEVSMKQMLGGAANESQRFYTAPLSQVLVRAGPFEKQNVCLG